MNKIIKVPLFPAVSVYKKMYNRDKKVITAKSVTINIIVIVEGYFSLPVFPRTISRYPAAINKGYMIKEYFETFFSLILW
jgi:hypothetical protein